MRNSGACSSVVRKPDGTFTVCILSDVDASVLHEKSGLASIAKARDYILKYVMGQAGGSLFRDKNDNLFALRKRSQHVK